MKALKIKTLAALAIVAAAIQSFAGETVDFRSRPLLAGRARLASDGFTVSRTLGVANFSPELRWPVELVYDSSSEKSGAFGFAWRSPQLESSAAWDRDGVLWTTPWGEKVKFFPKAEKTPKDAIKIAVVEDAKKGRGFYAPYSDWEADTPVKDFRSSTLWTVTGRNRMKGWSFVYSESRLQKVTAPTGRSIEFLYERGALKSVSQDGVAFITAASGNGLLTRISVNGVETVLSYSDGEIAILPKTLDGDVTRVTRPRLVSLKLADLEPVAFSYAANHLAGIAGCGERETFKVQQESLEDRRANIRAAKAPRGKGKPSGRVSGRLLSDSLYSYAYGADGLVTLSGKTGDKAEYRYDGATGVFGITEFSGRKYTIYYFMRYDVAYLGKVRKIVDGEGRDLVGYRYDAKHGGVTRVRDRFGNDRNFEYDEKGNLVRVTRRAKGSTAVEPVASFKYAQSGDLAAKSSLGPDGAEAVTTKISYDPERRPIRVSDGRSETFVSYTRFGYPAKIRNHLGLETTICYNSRNMVGTVTDSDGIATEYSYSPAGLVTRIVRRDGADVIASLDVSYDAAGRPVSTKDQDGLVRSVTRDELGRVVKDSFPDGSAVEYAYDAVGRVTGVTDENGHKIGFSWSRFGLKSRTTAANQLTDYVRDPQGLLKEVVSSKDKKADRRIKTDYDSFGRPVKADYGNGETETFAYDAWGRVAKHTRGKKTETYEYDHFGRMSKKSEDGAATEYAYDAYGCRTLRRSLDSKGALVDEEKRVYDRYGRLSEISSGAGKVRYAYDRKGRVAKQFLGDRTLEFTYTKTGQLKSKVMAGRGGAKEAELKYWYSKSGRLEARLVNGEMQKFQYDFRGQLTGVLDEAGNAVEKYEYDRAGNVITKTVKGETTTYSYDAANQLVTATDAKGKTTKYAYDAAGRMVKEGGKTYKYGYLDKVLSVTEGSDKYTYDYHVDGQLATATYGGTTEDFLWDGLALVKRGKRGFVNEPHVGGGNPVMSSDGTTYFNDMLGTTLSATRNGETSASSLSAFGAETPNSQLPTHNSQLTTPNSDTFFTGKPFVPGLGHAFLMRNYRSDLGKWQTADPLGYPDGWNQMAYCNNGVTDDVDLWGCELRKIGEDTEDAPNKIRDMGTHMDGGRLCHWYIIESYVYDITIMQNYVRKRRWESIDGLEDILRGIGMGMELSGGYMTLTGVGSIPGSGVMFGGVCCHTAAEILNTINSWIDVPEGKPIRVKSPEPRLVDKFELHVLE